MSGIVCLLGLFLLPKSMATHLDMNHKRWSRTRELGCSRWASKSYVFLQWLGNCMELLRTPAIPQSVRISTLSKVQILAVIQTRQEVEEVGYVRMLTLGLKESSMRCTGARSGQNCPWRHRLRRVPSFEPWNTYSYRQTRVVVGIGIYFHDAL